MGLLGRGGYLAKGWSVRCLHACENPLQCATFVRVGRDLRRWGWLSVGRIVRRLVLWGISVVVVLVLLLCGVLLLLEHRLGGVVVAESIKHFNTYLQTPVSTGGVTFSFFDRFPRATLHLRNVVVRGAHPETFGASDTLLAAHSLFVEFEPLALLRGRYAVRALIVEQGYLNLREAADGQVNYDLLARRPASQGAGDAFELEVDRLLLEQMSVSYESRKRALTLHALMAQLRASLAWQRGALHVQLRGEGLMHRLAQGRLTYVQREHFSLRGNLVRDAVGLRSREIALTIDRTQLTVAGEYENAKNYVSLKAKARNLDLRGLLAFASQFHWRLPPEFTMAGGLGASIEVAGGLSSKEHLALTIRVDGQDIACSYRDRPFRLKAFSALYSDGAQGSPTSASMAITECVLKGANVDLQLKANISNFRRPSIYLTSKLQLRDAGDWLTRWSHYRPSFGSLTLEGEGLASFPSFDSLNWRNVQAPKFRVEGSVDDLALQLGDSLAFRRVSGAFTLIDRDITKGSITGLCQDAEFSVSVHAKDFLSFLLGGGEPRWTVNLTLRDAQLPQQLPVLYRPPRGASDDTSAHGSAAAWQRFGELTGELTLARGRWRGEPIDSLRARFALTPRGQHLWLNEAAFCGGHLTGYLSLLPQGDSSELLQGEFYPSAMSLSRLFRSFGNFGQKAIQAENIEGQLTGSLRFSLPLGPDSLSLQALRGKASISVQDGALHNVGALASLGKFIALEDLMHLRFQTLRNDFYISQGRLMVPQMFIGSSALSLWLSGEHRFSGRYAYHVQLSLSQVLFNRLRSRRRNLDENSVEGFAADSPVGLYLMVEGDATSAYVLFDKQAYRQALQSRIAAERDSLEAAIGQQLAPARAGAGSPLSPETPRPAPTVIWKPDSVSTPSTAPRVGAPTAPAKLKPKDPPPVVWKD